MEGVRGWGRETPGPSESKEWERGLSSGPFHITSHAKVNSELQ